MEPRISLNGSWLALYPSDVLAEDTCLPPELARFCGMTLAYNVHSKEEGDKAIAQALAAGALLLKPAADTFWGSYSGYFAEPDGHHGKWSGIHSFHWSRS